MSTLSLHGLKRWVKQANSPAARLAYKSWRGLRFIETPVVPGLHRVLYQVHRAVQGMTSYLMRVLYWTPLFKSQLSGSAPKLYLFGGMPCVLGSLTMQFGCNCRIAGVTTFSGRVASKVKPQLIVGDNCDIGWQSSIAVGRKVVLGNNVRIAGRAFLAGYPGHPLNAAKRANGDADLDDQVGDIYLDDDVWLATGVTVMPGVYIGKGTIVAAGSVVTKDLPAGVLAGGVPAKVIRHL